MGLVFLLGFLGKAERNFHVRPKFRPNNDLQVKDLVQKLSEYKRQNEKLCIFAV